MSVALDDDSTYQVVLSIKDFVSQPQDVTYRKEYSASVDLT